MKTISIRASPIDYKAKIKLSAGGDFLALPGPVNPVAYLAAHPGVDVLLVASNGSCWRGEISRNTTTSFKAAGSP